MYRKYNVSPFLFLFILYAFEKAFVIRYCLMFSESHFRECGPIHFASSIKQFTKVYQNTQARTPSRDQFLTVYLLI